MVKDDQPIRVGRIAIDPATYDVTVDNQRIELTLMQFNILKALARRPGWVHSSDQIADHLPDKATKVTPASLKNQVYRLRRQLGPAADQVRTIRGLGYVLQDKPAEPDEFA